MAEPGDARSASVPLVENRPRGIERLLDLQEIDLALDRLRARRAQLESQEDVRAARGEVTAAEARLGELQLAIDTVSREQRRLEGDVDSLEQKKKAEEKRLFDGSVANPKELQAIRAEVDGIAGRQSRLEDKLLELMEQREEQDAQLGPLEREVAEARERLTQILQGDAKELEDAERSLAERAREREALLPGFDDDLLVLYEDLRRQKKGVGAAALRDGVCLGCHQKLSAMELDRLKRASGIRRCDYCRRILVFA
jgi:predicted  nucleic acid-binding Zn-ribbon protein